MRMMTIRRYILPLIFSILTICVIKLLYIQMSPAISQGAKKLRFSGFSVLSEQQTVVALPLKSQKVAAGPSMSQKAVTIPSRQQKAGTKPLKPQEVSVQSKQQRALAKLNSAIYSRKQLNNSEMDSSKLYIEDIFIGIKSTKGNHERRIDLLLTTWIPQASSSVYLFTDGEDKKYSKLFGKHYVDTKCGAGHTILDLLCKLQKMYDVYMFLSKRIAYKWWCSVDDDVYMNIPNFVNMLRNYDPNKDWYIGKPSLETKYNTTERKEKKDVSFWFATGGAGICISHALVHRMLPLVRKNGFVLKGKKITNPDDTTLGYVCNYLLGVPLTVIPEMYSHLEPMWKIHPVDYYKLITFSWGQVVASKAIPMGNHLLIRDEIPQYPRSIDPTRALTLHCYLFTSSEACRRIQDKYGKLSKTNIMSNFAVE